jgi:hypothetical protein
MTFRQLAASFGPRRPPYLLRAYPQRTEADIITWMRINGGEKVLGWCRLAFPSWRPVDVLAAMFGQAAAAASDDASEAAATALGRLCAAESG